MLLFLPLATLTILPLGTNPSAAVDLTRIDRTIAKEPAYKSKPRYCLLVFGPEAKTRVWLVLDGEVLYVDRNGNGDLTEPGERVVAKKSDDADEEFSFRAGEIRDGMLVHKNLTVGIINLGYLADRDERVKEFLARNPQGRGYQIGLDVEMPGPKGVGIGGRVEQLAYFGDGGGLLQFADRPQDAPIVHFGGPWKITLVGRQQLTAGRDTDLILEPLDGLDQGRLARAGTALVSQRRTRPSQHPARPPLRHLVSPT